MSQVNLPALTIELTGMVKTSNLAEFRETALAVIGAINTDLQTDEDFAGAENAIKWAKEVEDRLDEAKQRALSQTASIEELFRAVDDIKEKFRGTRLELDRLVKSRKESIRVQIINEATAELAAHIATLERGIAPLRLPPCPADFGNAIKGKKTVQSLREAASAELARAQLVADEAACQIAANVKALDTLAGDYLHLFPDLGQICAKPADHFEVLVRARIAEHKEAERRRLEAEQARIRAQEEARARRDADARLEAERASIRLEERAKAQPAPIAAEERPATSTPAYTVRLLVEVTIEPQFWESREGLFWDDLELHSELAGASIGAVRVLQVDPQT